jgi:hypothetical protein
MDYGLVAPLILMALTVPFWAYLWITRKPKRKTPAE